MNTKDSGIGNAQPFDRPLGSTDPSYIPDVYKTRKAAELEKMQQSKFIRSPGSDMWHIGLRTDLRGVRSGLLLSVWYRTACNGRQLGGPWGQHETIETPENICPRCVANAAKRGIAIQRREYARNHPTT